MDIEQKKQTTAFYLGAALTLFVVALLAAIFWFGFGVVHLYRFGLMRPEIPHHYKIGQPDLEVTSNQIQGWMTFHYLSNVFHIPPETLAAKLSITDAQYINKTLNQYAKNHNLSTADFITQVKNTITILQNTSKS